MTNPIPHADLYDVVAANIETKKVRLFGTNKTHPNAEAIVMMATMRRGVDEEFFCEVEAGLYREGDTWTGRGSNG